MLKKKIAVLVFSCLASLPFAVSAAESSKAVDHSQAAPASESQVSVVNLNTADAETLQSVLIGIGKVKAQAIVDHRNANGPFASVDELLEVKGIGAATLEKNRDRISLN
ncbi:helix-hairpin-helix domain-containing protein [Pseudomonas sp. PDM15]|uniref:ComEA family DNA-binding protein n=1 Tax=Pseudomonas sp. PDM15 TaxID=2769303 RepID=UPI00177CFEEA|nr:helix-hairpin-helix domain-containing protein [Pseudomonas sp. PDM15]MBD9424682.1 helix-hairpin-helix domain-containing protein [Pseudomonas sp. PDM15]